MDCLALVKIAVPDMEISGRLVILLYKERGRWGVWHVSGHEQHGIDEHGELSSAALSALHVSNY